MSDPTHNGSNNSAGSAEQSCINSGNEKKPGESKAKKKKPVKIRASLFFDGTQNNRTNIDHRAKNDDTYKKMKGWTRKAFSTESYDSDYSNIAKLERHCIKLNTGFDKHFPQYIEGIGTTDGETDSKAGMAMGKGSTGIEAKVKKGINNIVGDIIKNVYKQTETIENLSLDVFGFSRGAAAARHFVFAALEKEKETIKEKLEANGYEVSKVEVKFVGLFDTVAAFGLPGNHKNNTADLHLDAISKAQSVVQLAAADEFRKNFPLTNIKSKGGIEILLPGAHSDIGGGYKDFMDEVNLQVLDIDAVFKDKKILQDRFNREKQWLIDEGWCEKSEIQDINFWNELKISRFKIRNGFSRIPLHIMKKYAKDNGLNFRLSLDIYESVSKDLNEIKNILGDDGKGDWKKEKDILKKIRHRFFHFSAFYGTIGMAPSFTNDDPLNGKRNRIIYDG